MKINFSKARNKGFSVWLVILFLLFVIFILGVAYIIVTTLQEWFERRNRPDKEDEQGMYLDWKADMEECGYTFTNPIAVTWESTVEEEEWSDVAPLRISSSNNIVSLAALPSQMFIDIERSTNLVYWEVIATIIGGGEFTDTNMPFPKAFYRRVTRTNNIVSP